MRIAPQYHQRKRQILLFRKFPQNTGENAHNGYLRSGMHVPFRSQQRPCPEAVSMQGGHGIPGARTG